MRKKKAEQSGMVTVVYKNAHQHLWIGPEHFQQKRNQLGPKEQKRLRY